MKSETASIARYGRTKTRFAGVSWIGRCILMCSGGVDGAHPAKCPRPAEGGKPMRKYGVKDKDEVLGSSPYDTLINQSEIMSWNNAVLVSMLRSTYRSGGALLLFCCRKVPGVPKEVAENKFWRERPTASQTRSSSVCELKDDFDEMTKFAGRLTVQEWLNDANVQTRTGVSGRRKTQRLRRKR